MRLCTGQQAANAADLTKPIQAGSAADLPVCAQPSRPQACRRRDCLVLGALALGALLGAACLGLQDRVAHVRFEGPWAMKATPGESHTIIRFGAGLTFVQDALQDADAAEGEHRHELLLQGYAVISMVDVLAS